MPDNNQKKLTQLACSSWMLGLIVIVGAIPVGFILSAVMQEAMQKGSLKTTIIGVFFFDFLPICGGVIGAYAIIRGLREQLRACVLHGFAGFILNLCLAGLSIPHLPSYWEPRPLCHKQVSMFVEFWKDGNKTNVYPNVSGISSNSLVSLNQYSGSGWDFAYLLSNYKYVPGLKEDDPDDLILMYFDKPTRCTWHADSPTFSRPRKWVVVPPGFYFRGFDSPHNGENSDWIDTAEFKTRLLKTLDFLRENNRPFWTNVVAEHTEFLKTIKE